MASRPSVEDLPVWQLELPPAEPPAWMADSDVDEPSHRDEPAGTGEPPIHEAEATYAAASALVALGGVSFAIGHLTSSGGSSAVQTTDFRASASGAPGFAGGGSGAGAATIPGTVVSATTDSMTLQLANGQTVTIATGASTTYHGETSATSGDVTTGSAVIVQTSGTGSATSSASPGAGAATASASPGTGGVRTATSVTITSSRIAGGRERDRTDRSRSLQFSGGSAWRRYPPTAGGRRCGYRIDPTGSPASC